MDHILQHLKHGFLENLLIILKEKLLFIKMDLFLELNLKQTKQVHLMKYYLNRVEF
jgi:hypothetical protein